VTRDEQVWTIPVDETGSTTAVWEPAVVPSDEVVLFAHGAGGHMGDHAVLGITAALRARGVGTVRFNFLYAERRQKRPDRMPQLLTCFEAVLARVRDELAPACLVLGGRSMGGRVASMLVATGTSCAGLLLLAYPLRPPGQPAKLRVGHLLDIRGAVLCVSGTRDAFCTPALMTQTLAGLGSHWRMVWLDQADHSFHVLKRSGRTNDEVLGEAADAIAGWARALSRTG